MAESEGLRELSADEAVAMVPILREEAIAAACYEEDAQDIDVAALHQGWLKAAKAARHATDHQQRCHFGRASRRRLAS